MCLLCGDELSSSDSVSVGGKGRSSLVAASTKRNDSLQEKLQSVSPLIVHVKCRKDYTRESTIRAVKRKECAIPEEISQKRLQSRTSSFDIQQDCLFCGEIIILDVKHKDRQAVSNVETLQFQDTVLGHAKARKDSWGDDIINRISHAHDLVAAKAKYHRNCAQSFLHKRVKRDASASKHQNREEAFRKLCSFLGNNDECQYSILELMEYMENFLNGDEGYSMKWFKQKLGDHYGEDITITNLKGKQSIVSFRESTYKLLNERWMSDKVTAENKERIIDMATAIILDDIRMTVYDCDEYPTMEGTENGQTMIPGSLKRLLYGLIDRRHMSSSFSPKMHCYCTFYHFSMQAKIICFSTSSRHSSIYSS